MFVCKHIFAQWNKVFFLAEDYISSYVYTNLQTHAV